MGNKVTNINWTSERELQDINECDDLVYCETDWQITFEYKGYNLFATLDFSINLYEHGEEETNSLCLDILDIDISIKEMLDENDTIISFEGKEEVDIQNQLAIDLKTEF